MSSEATQGQKPDLYGQLHPVETPELLDRKQKEFKNELTSLLAHKASVEDRTLVEEAQTKCRLATRPEFILMFLRCEVFNADKAAVRYVAYWKKRKTIFQDQALEPLTLKSLTPSQIQAMDAGVMTVMDAQDPTGRSIIYFDPAMYPPKSEYETNDFIAAFWIIFHAALERETTQQHGIIVLGDPGRAKFSQFDRQVGKELVSSLKGALPVRLSAVLIVHPPTFASIIVPIMKMFMNDRMRKRLRLISGSHEKVLAELEGTFGMTKSMLPTTIGGKVKIQHKEWLKKRSESGL